MQYNTGSLRCTEYVQLEIRYQNRSLPRETAVHSQLGSSIKRCWQVRSVLHQRDRRERVRREQRARDHQHGAVEQLGAGSLSDAAPSGDQRNATASGTPELHETDGYILRAQRWAEGKETVCRYIVDYSSVADSVWVWSTSLLIHPEGD